MKTKSRYNNARRALIFETLFVGIGAVAGAAGMLADPSGKAMGIMTGQNLRHLGVFDMLAFENRRKYGESFQLSRAVKYERGYCPFFAEPVLCRRGDHAAV